MTTLENLYHGNINPSEFNNRQEREEYKKLLSLVSTAKEKLAETLTAEQKKLFENYVINSEELSLIIEEEIFKSAFSLAIKMWVRYKRNGLGAENR